MLPTDKEEQVEHLFLSRSNLSTKKEISQKAQAFSKLTPRYPHLKLLIAIGMPPENLREEFRIAYDMLLGYIKLHNIEEHTIF